MLTVLYDGWALSYEPDSPAALHLMTLLSCQVPGMETLVALPAPPPDWLPPEVSFQVLPAPDTPLARLEWEQRALPSLAVRLGARLLHLVSSGVSLFGRVTTLVSPAGLEEAGRPAGFFDRLRVAASQGGMARLGALLWPEDLPPPAGWREEPSGSKTHPDRALFRLPPVAYPGLMEVDGDPGCELPETYVLYHGPGSQSALRSLLEAWSWAAQPLGEGYSLVLLSLGSDARVCLGRLIEEYGLGGTIHALPRLSPPQAAAVYRGCSAVLHPGQGQVSPWGGSLRSALACGKPVAAAGGAQEDAIAGPAAYLVPAGDARALGAALITILIEEEMAESLSQAGLDRAAGWSLDRFSRRLEAVYQQIIG